MSISFSVRLALSFLGFGRTSGPSNARKSLRGAVAGIAVCLIPLVVVMVVSDGMIEGITGRLVNLSSSHIRLIDYSGTNGFNDDVHSAISLAQEVPSWADKGLIATAYCERQGIALAVSSQGRMGATVRGIERDFLSSPSVTKLLTIHQGTLALDGENTAILGHKIASDLGLSVGQNFKLLTLRSNLQGKSIPRFTTFTVSAIVSSGYQELDALWIFIPLETAGRVLPSVSSQTFINVSVSNPFGHIDPLRNQILRNSPEGIVAYTWKELNRSQFHAFETTRRLLLFIMFLILFIAAVNISSALVMLVMERRKEIAILKSLGAHPSWITFAFVLCGFFTAFTGICIGMPIAIALSVNINTIFATIEKFLNSGTAFFHALKGGSYRLLDGEGVHLLDPAYYLEYIPVVINFRELWFVASATLFLSVAVSLFPSFKAGKEKPLDTLRKY
ncbi:MAG: ABC transporter permease [Spirochaetales bacterium]|nr:ABC transporter permease [Spirochaetales bacterium]